MSIFRAVPASYFDPLDLKAQADLLLEETAERLHRLLQEAVQHLEPFPPFPGAFFTFGIEVEATGAESPERGCVVLAPDGELYELVIGQDLDALALGLADPVALREEKLKPLENLHPREYVLYAYAALVKVVELLLERQAEASP